MATTRVTLEELKTGSAELSEEQRARLDALSDDAVASAAADDPDAPLADDAQLDRMVLRRAVRLARDATGLSQNEFARQFRLNPSRLKNWEQGRFPPDDMALAYLEVIRQAPDVVRKILDASRDAPKSGPSASAAE